MYQFINNITVEEALRGLESKLIGSIFIQYAKMNYDRVALSTLSVLRERGEYDLAASSVIEVAAEPGALTFGVPFTYTLARELQDFAAPENGYVQVLKNFGNCLVTTEWETAIQVLGEAESRAIGDWVLFLHDQQREMLLKFQGVSEVEVVSKANVIIEGMLGEDPYAQLSQYAIAKGAGELEPFAPFSFTGSAFSGCRFLANGKIVQ